MANVMQIQVENFLKIENEQMKIVQNNSYGQKLSETTNQEVEIMNSKRQLKRKQLTISSCVSVRMSRY